MPFRAALLAGLMLLVWACSLVLAKPQPSSATEPAESVENPAKPHANVAPATTQALTAPAEPDTISFPPVVGGSSDDPAFPYLTSCDGPSASFLPPVGYDYYFRPHYARVDALFLQRSNTTNLQDIVQTSGTAAPVVGTRDFDFPMVAGPRILLGKRTDSYSAWEGLYFGTHFWRSTITPSDSNNLDLPGAVGVAAADFRQADEIAVTYRSQLHNAELNYVCLRDGASVFAGFRYLNWNERLTIRSEDNANQSLYDLNTTNNLFGGQLGSQVCWMGPHVDWDLTGKAGIFGNTANSRQRLSDANDTLVLRDADISGSAFSFIGELNLNAVRRLNAVWEVRVGYNLILVTGLALAPDQLDFTNTPTSGTTLDREGSVLLHGVNVGMGAKW